jgi:ABC-2 type transport system ATP-binding protein
MYGAIEIDGLQKSFPLSKKGRENKIEAVGGVTLTVKQGEIFGFLGPNGAGKTTTLRMLTTLLPIDKGEAQVAGFDVKKQPQQVRRNIGYVSQLGGSDGSATGRENLVLAGRLYGMNREYANRRSDELIRVFDLSELVDRKVRTYSGGQKRRLELALGIIHQPRVLFLDEPTTGLDLQNRIRLWNEIRELRDDGTTIFLTTHYLEEADELANRLAIIDHGHIVAEGTSRELKQKIAGDVITIHPRQRGFDPHKIQQSLGGQPFVRETQVEGDTFRLYVRDGAQVLPRVIAILEANQIALDSVSLSQPSLNDVFLKQTGHSLRDTL